MRFKSTLKAPRAKINPRKFIIHDEEQIDDYFWLREKENPEVIDYLKAENAFTIDAMKHTEELQECLLNEMKSRIKEEDVTAPEIMGNYQYYIRMESGKLYKRYIRKGIGLNNIEETILDENELAEGHDYFSLGIFRISPNQQFLAYSVDMNGSERFTVYIKDLITGKILDERIANVSYGLEWVNDNKSFFYNVVDEAERPFRIFKHKIGQDPKKDELIYHEKNKSFFLSLSKSRDHTFIILTTTSLTTTEVHLLNANVPHGTFQVLQPRQRGVEYYAEHQNGTLIIRTNYEAENFKLVFTNIGNPTKENWKDLVPHRPTVYLVDFEVFKNHLVLHERIDGLKRMHIININSNKSHYISFNEEAYTCWKPEEYCVQPSYESNILRFYYSSLVTPNILYDYDMNTMEKTVIKQEELLGGFNSSDYKSSRISVPTLDGKKVYITLVYKKDLFKQDGSNPVLLFGYGAYGFSIDPEFQSYILSILDRGFIYAIAHIRGGSELGRMWYDQGRLLQKKNTFTDFIVCAEHLIKENYTSSNLLSILGRSAGGLLMGAVTNMRPDLFRAVIALVPFVDVINSMLDPNIPLTVNEYEEWGNPNLKEHYNYMKSYSPYNNVIKKNYPLMLVTGSFNDSRVPYWEPAKWVAKLRKLTDNNFLLFRTYMGEGHSGKSGRYARIEEMAFCYTFILNAIGILK